MRVKVMKLVRPLGPGIGMLSKRMFVSERYQSESENFRAAEILADMWEDAGKIMMRKLDGTLIGTPVQLCDWIVYDDGPESPKKPKEPTARV